MISSEDEVKLNQRAQRFGREQGGNKKYKNKISIKEMIQTVVGVANIVIVVAFDWLHRPMILIQAGGVMLLKGPVKN